MTNSYSHLKSKELLKSNSGNWFTSKEISQRLNISLGSVQVCSKRLREKNEVEFKKSGMRKGKRPQYFYKSKK